MAIALTAGSLFLIVCLSLLEGWFDRVFRRILFFVVMLAIRTTATFRLRFYFKFGRSGKRNTPCVILYRL